jgi:hypothetical protein
MVVLPDPRNPDITSISMICSPVGACYPAAPI